MKRRTIYISVSFFILAIVSVILVINFKRKTKLVDEYVTPQKGNYDILVYNTEPSFSSAFNKISDEYSNMSGISVAFVNKESNVLEDFKTEVPDIFMVKKFDELRVQRQYENVFDFYNSSEKTFREIVDKIPDNLKLKISDINNCGVPLTIRGFGLAVNQNLLSSIFGEGSYKSVVNDLITCSFNDFKRFVENIKSNSVTLNGNEYKIDSEGVKGIESVFSFPIDTSFAELFNNVLVNSFSTSLNMSSSDNSSLMSNKIAQWMKMIDLISSHSSPVRGSSFINLKENSKDNAIRNFSRGKSLFLVAEDSDYEKIKEQNLEVSKNLTFIPLKAPFESNDSNSKITIYSPYYFVINGKSEKLKMSQDFLTWIISSPSAQKLLIQELKFIPYNTLDRGMIENSLGRSSLNYFQCENFLEPIFQKVKTNWTNVVSQFFIKKYLSLREWTDRYYKLFEDYCIKKWNVT